MAFPLSWDLFATVWGRRIGHQYRPESGKGTPRGPARVLAGQMGTGREPSDVPVPFLPGSGDGHLRNQSSLPCGPLRENLAAPQPGLELLPNADHLDGIENSAR